MNDVAALRAMQQFYERRLEGRVERMQKGSKWIEDEQGRLERQLDRLSDRQWKLWERQAEQGQWQRDQWWRRGQYPPPGHPSENPPDEQSGPIGDQGVVGGEPDEARHQEPQASQGESSLPSVPPEQPAIPPNTDVGQPAKAKEIEVSESELNELLTRMREEDEDV